jgi:hypothetical protein
LRFRPARKIVYTSLFLVLAVVGLCAPGLLRDLYFGSISRENLTSLAVFAFGVTLALPIALRAWRWGRLELSEGGIRALVWTRPRARRWYPAPELLVIRWEDVREARFSGGVFKLRTERRRIPVDVLVFDDPQRTSGFIAEQLSGVGVVVTRR